ncbi:glutamine amidotransferase [Pseudomonas fluorescens]|uniref:glutamine amidotransferase n=1 Tax=Pseudomonas fluorescens TaxID=294 RepID=UPI001240B426
MSRLPLIGVTSCPLQGFVPAASDILDGLDGSLVTGASSNIELFFEHGSAIASYVAHDSARANPTMSFHATVEAGIRARQPQWQSVPSDAHASNNA